MVNGIVMDGGHFQINIRFRAFKNMNPVHEYGSIPDQGFKCQNKKKFSLKKSKLFLLY